MRYLPSFKTEVFCIQVIKLVIDNTALEEYEKVYFAAHPRAKKKPIAQPYHESINKWMIMKRPQMNALKQKWKEFIAWLVANSEYRDIHIEQCELKFTTYYGTARRHDIDNGCPKFIIDGFCENGFIIDDDSKHITSLTMQCFVDTENPRTEIEISVSKLLTDYKPTELKEEKPMATKKTKSKKISVTAMDEIMKRYQETETVQWNGLDVIIKKNLSMDDMLNFVDSVVNSCFDAQTGEYRPEAKDFAMRVNVLTRYANFSLPERNVEHQYQIAVLSGAVDMILNYVNAAQFYEMGRAIDAKIEHKASANIQVLTKKFDDVVTEFENLQAKLSTMFTGVSSDDLKKLAETLANGNFSEEKIVEAMMPKNGVGANGTN